MIHEALGWACWRLPLPIEATAGQLQGITLAVAESALG